ncbi:MAG: Gfo/Idh/MocA family oxidoreductase [Chitinophagaceae bacterium]|nr:MAG: Gfo/Idh/MocA family oxidoreductase [Chitinophagaceae bacterium]
MSKTYKWGILGAGRIARKFANDLKYVEGARLYAVGARTADSAHEFAIEFADVKEYDSYKKLVSDPEVDAIYVATPHGFHHEHVMLCLEHGKAVLCEKAFAINTREAKEMIALAQSKKVFLMEALWTKFNPHYLKTMALIRSGKIGKVKSLHANFGFKPFEPVPQRLFDPLLGGGTLLDIGIYNVFIALSVLGRPDVIEATAELSDKGIDMQLSVLFKYKGGEQAQLFSSFYTDLSNECDICGEEGRIRMGTRFFAPDTSITYYEGKPDTAEVIPYHREQGFGYQYEARHVQECLTGGLIESPVVTWNDTIVQMEVMDEIRKLIGVSYPKDK